MASNLKKFPLSERSERSQQQWLRRKLLAVAEAADPYSYTGSSDSERSGALWLLTDIIETLKESFPQKNLTTPSGEVWEGSDLPAVFQRVSLDGSTGGIRAPKGSLLHIALSLNADEDTLQWLLASGMDPVKFNEDTQNAPIGQMAYTGNHLALAVCRRGGFDLTLRVLPEHYPNASVTKPGSVVGTTLLHRVAQRFDNIPNAQKVLNELLLSGLSPEDTNAVGETARDFARGQARHLIDEWTANRDGQTLQGATTQASAKGRTVRI